MDEQEARELIRQLIPDGTIQAVVDDGEAFLFMVFTPDPEEGEMDPFYMVNKATKETRDFSPFEGGRFGEIMDAFEAAQKGAA